MKIGAQLIAAPLLTAVVALGGGGLYGVLSEHAAERERADLTGDLSDLKQLAATQEKLSLTRAEVYRVLTLIASLDDAKVKAFRADLARQVKDVQAGVEALPAQAEGETLALVSVHEAHTDTELWAAFGVAPEQGRCADFSECA